MNRSINQLLNISLNLKKKLCEQIDPSTQLINLHPDLSLEKNYLKRRSLLNFENQNYESLKRNLSYSPLFLSPLEHTPSL